MAPVVGSRTANGGCAGMEPYTDTPYAELRTDSSRSECPTCRGLGTIPRDDSNLVALIPVSDNRLKPRRTKWYILGTVIVMLILGALLLFFLLGRPVSVSTNMKAARMIGAPDIDKDKNTLGLQFEIDYTIKNENYFSAGVEKLKFSSLLYSLIFLEPQLLPFKSFNIPMRSSSNITVRANITLTASAYPYVGFLIEDCSHDYPANTFLFRFDLTLDITALTSDSQAASEDFIQVTCNTTASALEESLFHLPVEIVP